MVGIRNKDIIRYSPSLLENDRLADAMTAFGSPHRFKLLVALYANSGRWLSVNDVFDISGLEAETARPHLNVLAKLGVIRKKKTPATSEKRVTNIYSLDENHVIYDVIECIDWFDQANR